MTFLVSMLYNCDAHPYLTAQQLSFGGTKHKNILFFFLCAQQSCTDRDESDRHSAENLNPRPQATAVSPNTVADSAEVAFLVSAFNKA